MRIWPKGLFTELELANMGTVLSFGMSNEGYCPSKFLRHPKVEFTESSGTSKVSKVSTSESDVSEPDYVWVNFHFDQM